MKEKYRRATLLVLILFMALSCGCSATSNENNEISVPIISEDYIFLASENVYLEYRRGAIMLIPLISSIPLTKDVVEVFLSDEKLESENYGITTGFGREEKAELPFYLYQCYRGKDWKAYTELQLEYQQSQDGDFSNIKESNAREDLARRLEETQNEFLEDYQTLQAQGKVPAMYSYLLFLSLTPDEMSSDMPFSEITLEVNGKMYSFSWGEVCAKTSALPADTLQTLVTKSGLAGWYVVEPSATGEFRQENGIAACLMSAAEDLTITDLRLWDDERSISQVQVVILNEPSGGDWNGGYDETGEELPLDIVADYMWDGHSPIELTAGQLIYFNFTFIDTRLANALCGYTEYYLEVIYKNATNETASHYCNFPMRIETVSGDPFELYLTQELNIDVMSYYRDFYYVLEETKFGIITLTSES